MEHNKIKKFYEQYKVLQKSSRNKAEKFPALFKWKETRFIDDLDDLFDIDGAGSDKNVSEEAKHFLIQQRMKGRPGTFTFSDPIIPEEESFFFCRAT